VPDIEAALIAVGVGIGSPTRYNQYGLVGFGGDDATPHYLGHSHLVGGMLFGTASELVVAAGTLVLTGDTEDGYDGVQFALDNYPFREDALRMVILVTDEDRDVVNGSLSFAGLSAALSAAGVTLHAILDVDLEDGGGSTALAVAADGRAYIADGFGGVTESAGGVAVGGSGSTIADYVDLVFTGSGLAGDHNQILAGGDEAESFATAMQLNLAEYLSVATLPPDVDVFAYTSPVNGRLEVKALFEDDVGNLDLQVLDIFTNVVAAASVMTDAEKAVLPVVAGETYYLEVSGAAGAVNNYTLEIETFEAPVPDSVVLDPNDDTGWSIWDNITAEPEARIFIEADLYAFADAGIDILSPAEVAAQESGAAVAVSVNGNMVGYATPIAGTNNTLFEYTFEPGELSTTFMPVSSGGGENLVKAAVEVFDGQGNQARGRTLLSEPLILVLDISAPDPPTPDLQASSDDGDSDTDNITSIVSPTFQGIAEARALLTLSAHAGATLLGTAIVGDDVSDSVPGDGLGAWYLTVGPLAAGLYDVTASVEDAAGNTSGPSPPLEVTILGPASANDDRVAIMEDQTINGLEAILLSNDSPSLPGLPHQIVSVNDVGTRGALVLNGGTGALSYTASGSDFLPEGETGHDSFMYTFRDAAGFEAVAKVLMVITGVNDPPVAVNDDYTINEDKELVVPAPGILENDTDADGPFTAALVLGPSRGILDLSPDGSFTYTPQTDWNGMASFTYTANDGMADSNVATVEINILPVPDPPVADAGGVYFVPRGRKLVLDGSDSFDPDEMNGDAIVSWDWDLNRDGFYGDVSGEMVTLPWGQVRSSICLGPCRAGPARRYRVRLEVEDTIGLLGQDVAFVDIVKPRFRDNFHPEDWPTIRDRWSLSGRWANRSGRLVASKGKNNRAIAITSPVHGGVLQTDLWLDPVKFEMESNAALIFTRLGPFRFRFVKVTPTGISIGQRGDLGSEPPGIKDVEAMGFPTDTRINLRVDIHPDGWVRAYLDGSPIPVISHKFAESVRGDVGLWAKKAHSTFDNFYLLPKRVLR
jgi:hypothetical protein